MSAISKLPPSRVSELLDRHFGRDELSLALGTDDERSLALARSVTWDPLSHLLARPGKEIRARIVEHAYTIASHHRRPQPSPALPPDLPYLLELLHAGSLIVDDVEDDAEVRRGAPALHRIVGTPRAINAGNFLYFLPMMQLLQLSIEPEMAMAMQRRLAGGLLRCHHGQALDLTIAASDLLPSDIVRVVELSSSLKTGALMELACAIGAIAAKASPSTEAALATFGREVGVALQMLDDISSAVVPRRRDKGIEDLLADRPTWVWGCLADVFPAHSIRGLQSRASEVARGVEKPNGLLADLGAALSRVADAPTRRWQAAVHALRREVGDLPSIEALVIDLRSLERSYVTT